MKELSARSVCGVLLLAIVLFGAMTSVGQDDYTVADQLAMALNYYNQGEFDKGLEVGQQLLAKPELTQQDSVAIYEVMSILTYAKGEDFFRESLGFLKKISNIGPCVIHLPREIWPAELRDKWFEISNAKGMLTCPEETGPGFKTIAIMEFDNFSVGKYQEELGALGAGLAEMFRMDFSKISSLKVIERAKVNYVLKEQELQQSGAVNKATAVKAGEILGAQYMIFGSLTQIDSKNTRMIVRVVSVETTEIVASVDKEGKPDYFQMEKELVEELAELLDIELSDDVKALIKEGGTASVDATTLYAKGLEYMDRYDYRNAYEYFKRAYDLDNSFVEAKRKMEIYQPLAS